MELTLFQVDAFTDHAFGGNPAAVIPLRAWLPDAVMRSIAIENNLSETAFFVFKGPAHFHLRWFTPADEVELCGHATLATSHVIFTHLGLDLPAEITFDSLSGPLRVTRSELGYTLDFPTAPLAPAPETPTYAEAIGAPVLEAWRSMDDMVVVESEAIVRTLSPDMGKIAALDARGLIVTAPGDSCDFVSRFFAPRHGIPEDPVTGSAHCIMAPYWAERLGRSEMSARQLSARGGDLRVRHAGARTLITGRAVDFMRGVVTIPDNLT